MRKFAPARPKSLVLFLATWSAALLASSQANAADPVVPAKAAAPQPAAQPKPATEKPATNPPAADKPATEKPAPAQPAPAQPAPNQPAPNQSAPNQSAPNQSAPAQPAVEKPAAIAKPIAVGNTPVAQQLRAWFAEGTAAGNVGDWYDNRDGGHSELNRTPYPQLDKIVYSPEDIRLMKHWAAQRSVLPQVVFGNSSTSATVTQGGSNIRHYYVSTGGLELLWRQYRQQNLYIYPEHRDHDPAGSQEGYGDLYPTNTPYLIASQGSSGSDQPFMRALAVTLAAFRPEVKRKLIESGLLMPAVQMIFRRSNKHLADPAEYFTGKAHPTVFEGSWVNELGMIQLAHQIPLDALPPLAQLKVLDEPATVAGRDFFDAAPGEVLSNTPCAVARVFRSTAQRRRLIVSGADSFDANQRPLTYRWAVLRGPADQIAIRPRNPQQSEVEIELSYAPRRPIDADPKLHSNRIDLALFVSNGSYDSPPAFLTFYSLDSEDRTYDAQGRIVEVGYGAGQAALRVADWQQLLTLAGAEDDPRALWLSWTPEVRHWLASSAADHARLIKEQQAATVERQQTEQARQQALAAVKQAQEQKSAAVEQQRKSPGAESDQRVAAAEAALLAAEQARQQAEAKSLPARQRADAATRAVEDFLTKPDGMPPVSRRAVVEQMLSALVGNAALFRQRLPELQERLKSAPPAAQAAIRAEHDRQAAWGLVDKPAAGATVPLAALSLADLALPADAATPPTRFVANQQARCRATLAAQLALPGIVQAVWTANYVDPRLSWPKDWRDSYRYDNSGNLLGWKRQGPQGSFDMTRDGLLIVERDEQGRCLVAQSVNYQITPPDRRGAPLKPLAQLPGKVRIRVAYDGPNDQIGREAERTELPANPPAATPSPPASAGSN